MAQTAAVDLHHGAGSRKKSDADRCEWTGEANLCDVHVCCGVHVSSHAALLHDM
jgi:hypothetical protein